MQKRVRRPFSEQSQLTVRTICAVDWGRRFTLSGRKSDNRRPDDMARSVSFTMNFTAEPVQDV